MPSRRAPPSIASSLALSALLSLAPPARGQGGDAVLAEALFAEGKRLMADGNTAEACPKLARSHSLDPAGGTVLLLGLCLERQGKTASSWAALSEALSLAERDHNADRERVAREHLASLEPRLVRLRVVVDASTPGLEIRRDGALLPVEAWGLSAPVDPGEHTVEAQAPGRVPFSARLSLAEGEATREVTVPPLALPAPAPRAEGGTRGARRSAGYAAAGVGAIALGVGAYLGIRTLSDMSEARRRCGGSPCEDEGARALRDRASSTADWATAASAVGAAASGLGVYLILSGGAQGSAAALRPLPGGAELSVRF